MINLERDYENLADRLVGWIRRTVGDADRRGAVFGLSGGVDSSVVASLCKRAFPDDCLGLIMPCLSNPLDIEHATLLASKMEIPTKQVVLDQVYERLLGELGDFGLPKTEEHAKANVKPRLRMATLYYAATRLDYLVAGTGNRSEATVGYFTKYGDGGVDMLPIGNLVKSEVYALARFLGVPAAIIEKPPTAGLWADQTDEDEMGVTYQVLDRYILTGEAPNEVRERVDEMNRRSEHKRKPPLIPSM